MRAPSAAARSRPASVASSDTGRLLGSGYNPVVSSDPTPRLSRAWRPLAAAAALGALVLVAGWALSQATTRVVNWYVMTDELFYERLGISIAQTGSPLPRLRGESVDNVNQFYPLLLSVVFGNGDVPASLAAAHRLNAFVMASAAIPVYLLARRIDVGRLASLWVAFLAVATPWIVLASFLMTAVLAYPVFCWAILALTVAVQRRSTSWDLLAIASVGLAVLARTQFAVLAIVFVVAVVADALLESAAAGNRGSAVPRAAGLELLRTRRVLVALVLAGAAALAVVLAMGDASSLLGTYGVTTSGIRLDTGLVRLAFEHLATLALATAVLPFVVGSAWLLDRLRPSSPPAVRAFASVGCAAVLLVTFEVASFTQRFGAGEVSDRYIFYLLPIVLVGLGGAVVARSWPSWWAWIAPLAIVFLGFAWMRFPHFEKLNVDTPAAVLDDDLLRIAGSVRLHLLLPVAAAVLVGLFVELSVFVSRRAAQIALVVLVTAALPFGAFRTFDRLFAVNGTNGLPITLDQGVVFDWVDRAVGKDGRVTVFPYPVNSPDYWAGIAYWWDVEFWNESAVLWRETATRAEDDAPWADMFDPRTGAVLHPETTRYVLSHGSDVRFRLAGKRVEFERGAYLTEVDVPWRAEWSTDQIYSDGWTGLTLRCASMSTRCRASARRCGGSSPWPSRRRRTISLDRCRSARTSACPANVVPPEQSVDLPASVCVPPGGHADVEIETPIVSDVYRDPTVAPLTGETDRPAGVLLRSIALADETEPLDRCPDAPEGSSGRASE